MAKCESSWNKIINFGNPAVPLGEGAIKTNGLFISSQTQKFLEDSISILVNKQEPPAALVQTLKNLRNKLIGHEMLKIYMVHSVSFPIISILAGILENNASFPEAKKEACILLGSFAYGGESEIRSLLDHGVPQLLLRTWYSNLATIDLGGPILVSFKTNILIAEAAMRALRTIYRQRGLPKDLPFNSQYIPALIQLLNSTLPDLSNLREYTSILLANCCDSYEKQRMLTSSGLLQTAIAMATGRDISWRTLNSSLELFSALTHNNQVDAKEILGSDLQHTLVFLFDLLGKRYLSETRILAAICIANLCKIGPNSRNGDLDTRIAKVLLPSLAGLLDASCPGRAKAAQVLAMIIGENEQLQVASCDYETIPKLIALLSSKNDLDQEAALLAFSAIASFKEECRRLVMEAKILHAVMGAMDSRSEAVRSAACQCTRSLSRSVKNLRTFLVDAGMAIPLIKLLRDPSITVQKTACAALCNLVLDFSALKETVLKEGGVSRLVELLNSDDADLRFNSVWALKNLLYLADTPIKEATIRAISLDRLEQLARDEEPVVQEQAMNLIRNLVCEKEQDIGIFLDSFGQDRLIKLLEGSLLGGHDEIVQHSCYVIANICTASSPEPKIAIMNSSIIIDKVTSLLTPGRKNDLLQAALWCIINLTWTDDSGSVDRIQKLKRIGVDKQLEALKASGLAPDARDRVQTALNNFEADTNITSHNRSSRRA